MSARRPFKKNNEIYAFIDSQNLNVSVQKLGWKINWQKFREFLTNEYGVTKAYMFIGYMPEFQDMYEQLHEAGYAIVLKQTFDMTRPQPELLEEKELKALKMKLDDNEDDDRHIKGNVDTDLVLWTMKEMPKYRQAVIVSGDGDFYSLIEYLVQKKKIKALLAPTGHYSNLFNRFDKYVDRLDKHKKELEYRDKRSKGRKKK